VVAKSEKEFDPVKQAMALQTKVKLTDTVVPAPEDKTMA
jgi:hypothetical protein